MKVAAHAAMMLALALIACQSHAQLTKKISEAEARRLISEHYGLWITPPQRIEVRSYFSSEKHPNAKQFYERLQSAGYIQNLNVEQLCSTDPNALQGFDCYRASVKGGDSRIAYTVTKKTLEQAIPYEETAQFCLEIGKRGIERIIGITEDNTVLFVGLLQTGVKDAGRVWGYERDPSTNRKIRARAKFKYDPFLEGFSFLGWEWNEMDQENGWRSDWTNWIESEDGRKVCKASRIE